MKSKEDEEEEVLLQELFKNGHIDRSYTLKFGEVQIKPIEIPIYLRKDHIRSETEEKWILYEMRDVCFIVTTLQHIYAFGNNEYGQLGLITLDYIDEPTRVDLPLCKDEKIKCIYSNSSSTFISTSTSALYATGLNNNGQLGIGSDKTLICTLTKVNLKLSKNEEVQFIVTSWNSTFISTTTNNIFACGYNEKGQLGITSKELNIYIPTRVQVTLHNDEDVKFIFCSCFSTFISTTTSRIYATGWNDDGQLGVTSEEEFLYTPIEVKLSLNNESLKHVDCFTGSTCISTDLLRKFICGLTNFNALS